MWFMHVGGGPGSSHGNRLRMGTRPSLGPTGVASEGMRDLAREWWQWIQRQKLYLGEWCRPWLEHVRPLAGGASKGGVHTGT